MLYLDYKRDACKRTLLGLGAVNIIMMRVELKTMSFWCTQLAVDCRKKGRCGVEMRNGHTSTRYVTVVSAPQVHCQYPSTPHGRIIEPHQTRSNIGVGSRYDFTSFVHSCRDAVRLVAVTEPFESCSCTLYLSVLT